MMNLKGCHMTLCKYMGADYSCVRNAEMCQYIGQRVNIISVLHGETKDVINDLSAEIFVSAVTRCINLFFQSDRLGIYADI